MHLANRPEALGEETLGALTRRFVQSAPDRIYSKVHSNLVFRALHAPGF
jgi:hypothetical protein